MMASKENLYNYRFILIIFLLVCFDIFTKVIANNSLLFGQSVDTVFPFIELLLIFNTGIAFGIFDNKGELSSNLLLIVTILIKSFQNILLKLLKNSILREQGLTLIQVIVGLIQSLSLKA